MLSCLFPFICVSLHLSSSLPRYLSSYLLLFVCYSLCLPLFHLSVSFVSIFICFFHLFFIHLFIYICFTGMLVFNYLPVCVCLFFFFFFFFLIMSVSVCLYSYISLCCVSLYFSFSVYPCISSSCFLTFLMCHKNYILCIFSNYLSLFSFFIWLSLVFRLSKHFHYYIFSYLFFCLFLSICVYESVYKLTCHLKQSHTPEFLSKHIHFYLLVAVDLHFSVN